MWVVFGLLERYLWLKLVCRHFKPTSIFFSFPRFRPLFHRLRVDSSSFGLVSIFYSLPSFQTLDLEPQSRLLSFWTTYIPRLLEWNPHRVKYIIVFSNSSTRRKIIHGLIGSRNFMFDWTHLPDTQSEMPLSSTRVLHLLDPVLVMRIAICSNLCKSLSSSRELPYDAQFYFSSAGARLLYHFGLFYLMAFATCPRWGQEVILFWTHLHYNFRDLSKFG